jgi:hypothetical protein
MPAAAIAIPAAISAGTSIFGGLLGSRAAKKAGQMQSDAALGQVQGFRDTLAQYNPQIGAAAERGGQMAMDAAGQVRTDALGANELLSPYTQLGGETAQSLREFMAPGGAGQRTFTAADMEAYDPGYQFRLDKAQQAAEKSAAARGGLLGGGFAKALAREQQGLASSEFANAESRFRQQQTDRYNRLFGVTELGSRSAGEQGRNLMTAGEAGLRGATAAGDLGFRGTVAQAGSAMDTQRMISDLMTGGAAAQAAGKVGSANAWGDALGGVGQAAAGVGNYYQDKSLLRDWMKMGNPALTAGAGGANVYNLPNTGSYRWGMPGTAPVYPPLDLGTPPFVD